MNCKGLTLVSLACLGASFLAPHSARAADPLDFNYIANQAFTQEEYQKLVQPIANPTRYMFMTSGRPLGILGFDVGVGASFFALPDEATEKFKTYIEGGDKIPSFLAIPRITAQKGLPFGIDVGVNLAFVPNSSLKLIGLGVQYTAFEGIWPLPDVSVRAGYSAFVGLEELGTQSFNVEAMAGTKILIVEPYAGVGYSRTSASSKLSVDVNGTAQNFERSSSWNDTYALLGARLSVLPFIGLTGEAQLSPTQALYTVKASVTF